MKDVSFGQYYNTTSFVHKMDARVKILLSIAYIVAVFLVKEFHFYGFLAAFLFIVLTTIFSKVPFFSVLRSVKGILFFVIFSAVLQIFFNTAGEVVFSWKFITITDKGLLKAGFIVCRIMMKGQLRQRQRGQDSFRCRRPA